MCTLVVKTILLNNFDPSLDKNVGGANIYFTLKMGIIFERINTVINNVEIVLVKDYLQFRSK